MLIHSFYCRQPRHPDGVKCNYYPSETKDNCETGKTSQDPEPEDNNKTCNACNTDSTKPVSIRDYVKAGPMALLLHISRFGGAQSKNQRRVLLDR